MTTPLFAGGEPYFPLPTQFVLSISNVDTNHSINMDIVGDTLYLCSAWGGSPITGGLTIFDITDRANPIQTGFITHPTHINAISGVKVHGNYAFCACEQAQSLTVCDLTTKTVVTYFKPWADPVAPETQGGFVLSGACSIVLNAAGTIAYISTITRQSLAIIDISNPLAPFLVKEVRSLGTTFSMAGCRDVVINEAAGIAYVACEYTNNIAVIDISTGTIVTTVQNPANHTQRGLTLDAAMNRLYVVGTGNGHGGMDIWDVSDPRAPVLVKNFQGTATANFYAARGVVFCENYVYLCSEYGDMFIIVDISNELAPVVVATETGPTSTSLAEALWMKIQDGYAYIAQFGATNSGLPPGNALSVIKINDPYPTPVGK